jgi:hypothetical protein
MLIALFLPWYSVAGEDITAWQSMALDDVILALAAVLAILAALSVGLRRLTSLSVATTSLVILPAGIGLIVTVYRLLSPAPAADASIEIGGWLGLVAALGMVVGAWQGAKDEGPARRNAEIERRAAAEALAGTELLSLPAEGTSSSATPVQG